MDKYIALLTLCMLCTNFLWAEEKEVFCLPPQKESETRVKNYDFGYGPVVHVISPPTTTILIYAGKDNTLSDICIETIILDNEEEQIIEETFMSFNTNEVSAQKIIHYIKTLERRTTKFYSIKGTLVAQEISIGQDIHYLDAEEQEIAKSEFKILMEQASIHIPLLKIKPTSDNSGKG
ncbi:MAG: hypothetical protein AAF571_03830 [Verrucomicrobiota bacterium]